MNRREFLKGTAWMGAAALAGGCMTDGFRTT
ncbi:MAG: twin-arginine translocation signal domain-containing protein [Lysinibacillus sp.]